MSDDGRLDEGPRVLYTHLDRFSIVCSLALKLFHTVSLRYVGRAQRILIVRSPISNGWRRSVRSYLIAFLHSLPVISRRVMLS